MAAGDIDNVFQSAMDAGKINGAIICATSSKGNFRYSKLIGSRTLLLGERRPHRLDDVLYLASASKLMTTIAALTCVEDSLLSLSGDLSSIAPELTSKQILTGFSDEGLVEYEAQTQPITLEMLLSHSSGLAYHFLSPALTKWREGNPDLSTDVKKSVETSFRDPLVGQPGTWMYGPGLDWAGRIVERVTGKRLLDRMQERIFGPLGFDDAQFFPVTREDLRARMVDLNPDDIEGTGKAVSGDGSINTRGVGDFGGHGLFMTAEGYLKVLRSILANDGKILRPDTVDMMLENHLNDLGQSTLNAALQSPPGQFFRVGLEPGSKAGYGLGGLLTMQDVEGWYGEKTLTWGGGQTFAWFIDRQNGLCGLAAIQARLPLDISAIMDLKQTFRHDVYRKKEQWSRQNDS